MNLRRNERGQAIVITVLALVALLGMCALVLDVGVWFRSKRRLQSTADAAALAGAQQLPNNPSAAKSMALDYAGRNGGDVANGAVRVTATFYPNDTISVGAKKTEPGIFSRVLGVTSTDITADAAARVGAPSFARYVAPMVVSCDHPLIKNCDGNGHPRFLENTDMNFDPMGAPGAFGMLNLSGGNGTPGTSEEAGWIFHGYDQYLDYNTWYRSDPGAKFSSQNLQSALDQRMAPDSPPLLFPVFKVLQGTG